MSTFAQADARRRVTLPPASGIKPGDPMEVELLEDGRVIITPIIAVPKHQAWAWAPEVMTRVSASLNDPRPRIRIASDSDFNRLAANLGIDSEELDED